jgi:hypothetical protein
MTPAVGAAVDARFHVLPSGVRIVRLGAPHGGWLREYDKVLRVAAADFLRRGHVPGTAEGVVQELAAALASPRQAVFLVLRHDFALLGFALAELSSIFGGPRTAVAVATYLRPGKTPRAVFRALIDAMIAWAAQQGATIGYFHTRRLADARAWTRIGARPIATIYAVPIPPVAPEAPHG